jgi:hypothetical protein
MNYYDLENQMWERQRDTLHAADRRRLVAMARARPDGQGGPAPRLGILAALGAGFRSLLVPGRTARIEHPRLGDAS